MSKQPNYCGQMETIIESSDSFISFHETNQTVSLEPGVFDDVGVNTQSLIRFRMVDYPLLMFTVIVEATIRECRVTQSSF